MRISIANRQRAFSLPRGWLRRVCKGILTDLDRKDAELSLLLVRDDRMRVLNREYRGKDAPTDVLAFSMQEGPPIGRGEILGDVVISLETAARQAAAHDRTLTQEVAHLVTHGILHLLGYDHEVSPEAARRMRAVEITLLRNLEGRGLIPPGGLPAPLPEG
ncbi:MAG: rRNA maturation RNase YbeY [Deltaproteobacteria bacterium]|nr:MAG: rRNA maturation RNase YbeY [Deltaproteobacteria bacterium]